MSVPFPRTVPDDAPGPPAPLLDQRAARIYFAIERREMRAVSYRLSSAGVTFSAADGEERFIPWAEIVRVAREVHGLSEGRQEDAEEEADDDPSRRDRRRQRRQDRRDG